MALITVKERSPQHRAYQVLAWGLALAIVVFLPAYVGQPFRINQLSEVLCFAVAIMGLNLLTGFSGAISIGHSAFVGLGAYTTVILVADYNWPFLLTLVVALPLCFGVGVLVGLPALRIRGLYLAVVTLALAFAFPALVLKYESLTGGPNGKNGGDSELLPPSWTPFDDTRYGDAAYIYFFLLIITGIAFLIARNILRSRAGRAVVAVRDNQTSAAVSGVNVPGYKTIIFGISAAFAGLAGSMFMFLEPFATDTRFGVNLAIFLVVGLVAGGAATLSGAFPGALLIVFVPWFTSQWSQDPEGMPWGLRQIARPLFDWLEGRPGAGQIAGIFFGLLLILLVFVLPGGIVHGLRQLRAKIIQVTPNPSWLNDVQRLRPLEGVAEDEATPDPASTPQPVM